MKTMKKTMNEMDVAALAAVVGGGAWAKMVSSPISPSQNKQIIAWTIFDGVVSTLGAAAGAWAVWREFQKDAKERKE